jgi:hypothetical protein
MEKSKDIFTLPAEFGWSDLAASVPCFNKMRMVTPR